MSSGFITESEALEARRVRQEEWDKVRTEDQPKEAPEEEYDNRPLFTRLEEQRMKKEAEFEEAHKLKNMIRVLDDDEVGFLDLVEETKAKQAQQITLEEQKAMREFRDRVSDLAETAEMQRLRAQVAPAPRAPPAQTKNKLQGMIVRKRKASEVEDEKAAKDVKSPKQNSAASPEQSVPAAGGLRCAGVLPGLPARAPPRAAPPGAPASPPGAPARPGLPGLGLYSDSSSDSCSSDSEIEQCCAARDLLGRRSSEHDKKKEDHKS